MDRLIQRTSSHDKQVHTMEKTIENTDDGQAFSSTNLLFFWFIWSNRLIFNKLQSSNLQIMTDHKKKTTTTKEKGNQLLQNQLKEREELFSLQHFLFQIQISNRGLWRKIDFSTYKTKSGYKCFKFLFLLYVLYFKEKDQQFYLHVLTNLRNVLTRINLISLNSLRITSILNSFNK